MNINKYVYDNPKNEDGSDKENESLGDFEIIYGDMHDYSFSVLAIDNQNGRIYNIVGDEVSGRFGNKNAGTKCRMIEVVLHRPFVA